MLKTWRMFLQRQLLLTLVMMSSPCMVSPLSRVYITPDGGYKGIVVNIDSDIDLSHLDELMQKIKVIQMCQQFMWLKMLIF